ncbi:ABC transporter ATP-binding protein [uncultured Sphaerochaeta sp.]|uniref:ABC transporter ATP-binding protein n=1 Tax=uncultured Sphaerochaeta sp. TaxID=886478 RepID=UPI002A0A34A6|nr:ABC transporter ATP-binding protein [uncultured Sphaerochaeta sp.]
MIEYQDLCFTYGASGFRIQDISISTHPGIMGLLGRNGSGKTTFMNLTAGLLMPQSGKILFNGESLFASRANQEKIKKKIGYLPAEGFFFDKLSLKENLELVGYLRFGKRKLYTSYQTIIDQMELGAHMNKRFAECSTGTKQKAQIVATLMGDPEILILDEPHNGLDIFTNKQLNDFLLSIKSRVDTLILSSHIVEIVEKLADYVVILENGQIIETREKPFEIPLETIYFNSIKKSID